MKKWVLLFFAVACFAAGSWLFYTGYDKITNYYNYESAQDYYLSYGEHKDTKNCYVGGDAYNYVINGTYFSGYCSAGGSFMVLGGVLLVGSFLVGAIEKRKNENSN